MTRYACPACGADHESLRTECTVVVSIEYYDGRPEPLFENSECMELHDFAHTFCTQCTREGKLWEFGT